MAGVQLSDRPSTHRANDFVVVNIAYRVSCDEASRPIDAENICDFLDLRVSMGDKEHTTSIGTPAPNEVQKPLNLVFAEC